MLDNQYTSTHLLLLNQLPNQLSLPHNDMLQMPDNNDMVQMPDNKDMLQTKNSE
jgi:hypothetical protein